MNRKPPLLIAVFATLSLAACHKNMPLQARSENDQKSVCDAGTTNCTPNGKLETCTNNTWVVSDCAPDSLCLNGKKACEIKLCDEAETTCHDNKEVLMTCINNAWIETPCVDAICAFGRCVECLTHDERVNNNVAEVCAANVWHKKQTEP